MMQKFNFKHRVAFYSGLLLFFIGLSMMPQSLLFGSMLDGVKSFAFTLMVYLPVLYIYFRFFQQPTSEKPRFSAFLPVITALAGLALLALGIIQPNGEYIDWGVFLLLVACEMKLTDPSLHNDPRAATV